MTPLMAASLTPTWEPCVESQFLALTSPAQAAVNTETDSSWKTTLVSHLREKRQKQTEILLQIFSLFSLYLKSRKMEWVRPIPRGTRPKPEAGNLLWVSHVGVKDLKT